MAQSIPRRKNSDILVDQIRTFIAAGGFKPGDPLPTEHALADHFGVSRMSVREATKTLGFLGVLEAKPGRGLTVGHLDIARLKDMWSLHPGLQDVSDGELIDSRVLLETGVLPHVARRMRMQPEIYERLSRINHRWRQVEELREFVELDIAFHSLLVESSGLVFLTAFNDLLQAFFRRFRDSVTEQGWRDTVKDHQRITDALRDDKPALAAKIVRRHIESHKACPGQSDD